MHDSQFLLVIVLKYIFIYCTGGLYFIEDLQISRSSAFIFPNGVSILELMGSWIDQLSISDKDAVYTQEQKDYIKKYPRPVDLKWIMCQREACVLAKCLENDIMC
jgi:hypothetical protein